MKTFGVLAVFTAYVAVASAGGVVTTVGGLAALAPAATVAQVAAGPGIDYYAHPRYSYGYGVSDALTGDRKSQVEARDGPVVRGRYSLVQPDGAIRVVNYAADDVNGFNAVVSTSGASVHPDPAVAAVAPVATVAAPVARIPVAAPTVDYYAHPRYSFAYGVSDGLTGDRKSHVEARDGGVVKGRYSLVQPDGAIRVVNYAADDVNGFNAVVSTSGASAHPAPAVAAAAPITTIAAAAPVATIAAASPTVDYYAHPRYSFAYGVSDALTGDRKSQVEARDGSVVKGRYSLVQPDGTIRVVNYAADDINGFNAVVSTSGTSAHPAASVTVAPLATKIIG